MSINCPIFLENSHRFSADPEWGEIMKRLRTGEITPNDVDVINSHYVEDAIDVSRHPDTGTACTTNVERNAVEFMTWKKYIVENHPQVDHDELPPNNVLFIECSMKCNKKRVSKVVHDVSHSMLSDDDMRSTNFSCRGAKISPIMRCYPGSHHMVNTND